MLPLHRGDAAALGYCHVGIAVDRLAIGLRAAVNDTERTLFIAVLLVIGVVFVFLQSPRAILIPAVALPLSIMWHLAGSDRHLLWHLQRQTICR